MQSTTYQRCGVKPALMFLLVFLWMGSAYTVQAQFKVKWMTAGELQNQYSEAGAEQEEVRDGLHYPAIYEFSHNEKAHGLWIHVGDFSDENGREYAHKVVHNGPRATGVGAFFPQELQLIRRYERPEVRVDDFMSFDKQALVDNIDPSIPADEIIYTKTATKVGITIERDVMQFSQEYHDNYHLTEWTYTNTGDIDGDDEAELNQTLENVYIFNYNWMRINQVAGDVIPGGTGWGRWMMNDMIGFGVEDFTTEEYGLDYRGHFSWKGRSPGFDKWDPIGAPILEDDPSSVTEGDTTGRLAAAYMGGHYVLHASKSASDDSNDPSQPRTMTYIDCDHPLTQSNDQYNDQQMAEEYDMMTRGRTAPHHADLVEPVEGGKSWMERMAFGTNDPSLGLVCGNAPAVAYGPYTLEPGDDIRIVYAEAFAGLSDDAAREIGAKYKGHHLQGNDNAPIDYDANGNGQIDPGETMSKNEWVMTSRDSLFQALSRIEANYESGYDIPSGPLPPRTFHVQSQPNSILLSWELYNEADPSGFQVWRAKSRVDNQYELITELPASARSYEDTQASRGVGYFYYIQAIGDANTDGTGNTPTGVPLKSNRYYTQTYDPAKLLRAEGSLSEARVVPNPYNINSDDYVRWPDKRDQIAFLEVPGNSTIEIYTELGELVETIRHTDGSGDEFWDLTTSSNQVVVSGIYMAVITNEDTGEQVIKDFVIIR